MIEAVEVIDWVAQVIVYSVFYCFMTAAVILAGLILFVILIETLEKLSHKTLNIVVFGGVIFTAFSFIWVGIRGIIT